MHFLPVITPRGTIRLEVAPEVSALDYTAGLTIQGYTIPGLSTRRVQTEIELETGQSFAIGGLLDRRLTETVEKVPLLSSVPLLGKLFQSKSANKQNNELLVIVTPEIVRPIPHGRPRPRCHRCRRLRRLRRLHRIHRNRETISCAINSFLSPCWRRLPFPSRR